MSLQPHAVPHSPQLPFSGGLQRSTEDLEASGKSLSGWVQKSKSYKFHDAGADPPNGEECPP